jgi:Uma2 family endonuclease
MIAGVASGRTWTEAELQALPHDGYTYELVDGELVMSPKNGFLHGVLCSRLLVAMETYNQTRKLGVVLDSSTGFWMENRNCRAPEVSFVSNARSRRVLG